MREVGFLGVLVCGVGGGGLGVGLGGGCVWVGGGRIEGWRRGLAEGVCGDGVGGCVGKGVVGGGGDGGTEVVVDE